MIEQTKNLMTEVMHDIEVNQAHFNEGLQVFTSETQQKFDTAANIQMRVAHVIELFVLHDKLVQGHGDKELIHVCSEALCKNLPTITHELASKHTSLPAWLKDDWWCTILGISPNEKMWQDVQSSRNRVHDFFKAITPGPHVLLAKDCSVKLGELNKARIVIENFDKHVDKLSSIGTDFIGITKEELQDFRAHLAAYKRGIVTIQETFESSCKLPFPSRYVKNITPPQCLSSFINSKLHFGNQPEILWASYATDVRDFVLKHYVPTTQLTGDAPCIAPEKRWAGALADGCNSMDTLYEQMMRKMVVACQLEQQLDAMAKVGICPSQAEEFHAMRKEVKDFSNCLAKMIVQCHDDIVFQNPHATFKDFHDVVIDIENELRTTHLNKQAEQAVLSKAMVFFGQVLCQRYLNLGVATNFHDSPQCNLGPLKFTLPGTSKDIVGEVAAQYGALKAQQVNQPVVATAATAQASMSASVPAHGETGSLHFQATQENASVASSDTNVLEEQKRTQELMRYAAQIVAVANCKQDKESQALAQAYEPLESVLDMSTTLPSLEQAALLLDEAQTAATHPFECTAKAELTPKIKEALDKVVHILTTESNFLKKFNQKDPTELRERMVGAAEGIIFELPKRLSQPTRLLKMVEAVFLSMILDAGIEQKIEDWGNHRILDKLLGTDFAKDDMAQLNASLQPSAAEQERFSRLSAREQAREMTAGTLEACIHLLLLHGVEKCTGALEATPSTLLSEELPAVAPTTLEAFGIRGAQLAGEAEALSAGGVKGLGNLPAALATEEIVPAAATAENIANLSKVPKEVPHGAPRLELPAATADATALPKATNILPAVEAEAMAAEVSQLPIKTTIKPAIKGPKLPANQVIKLEDRPISVKRIDYEAMQKHIATKAANTAEPLFKDAALKHICGIDKKLKHRVSGEINPAYSGYHYDKGFSLVKKGKVKFLSEPIVCPKTGAVKVVGYSIEGVTYAKEHTLFPPEWSQSQLIDKLFEASQNIIKEIEDGTTCLEVIGATKEGLEIYFVIRKADGFLITAYPNL